MRIQTVTGAIESSALGYCQPHEHLIVREGPATRRFPALLIDDEALSYRELTGYKSDGGRSVVDCQPGGAGRDVRALRRVSEGSGVNIIATTGYHMPMFYPEGHWVSSEPQEALAERFLRELSVGMRDGEDDTGIRAGAVKAAIGADGATGRFEALLSAAARAAAEAKVPLILHTEKGIGALDALALCEAKGLPAGKVLVCHVDRQATDFAIHEQIGQTGAMLEYDTIARYKYHDDESEIALIRHMLSRGYVNQLLLSSDPTRERLRAYGGSPGLSFILREFLPALRRAGVLDREIRAMTIDNPARAFA